MTKEERQKKLIERFEDMTENERRLRADGVSYIAGIDEVGRGPLAGPVYAACVVLPADFDVLGIDDSKKLSEKKRTELNAVIREKAAAYGIGIAGSDEIDQYNILNATKQAMKRAFDAAENMLKEKLGASIDMLLIDALKLDEIDVPQEAIIKGDAKSISIAAASIVAKVARDSYMVEMEAVYPGYGFAANKGYGTKAHYDGIRELGITPIHRRTFLKNFEEKHSRPLDRKGPAHNEGSSYGIGGDILAEKKIYAVRKGRNTGLFSTWDECKEQVNGFAGAEYKSFSDIRDAYDYLGIPYEAKTVEEVSAADVPDDGIARAYVDGSYDVSTGRFSCGAVILYGGKAYEISIAYDDPAGAELRNVAGEIMGAREAVGYCMSHGIKAVEIYHDYAGIGKWGDDEWKANLDMTREYKEFIRNARGSVKITFIKVKAHSGNKYNEKADKLAKEALGI